MKKLVVLILGLALFWGVSLGPALAQNTSSSPTPFATTVSILPDSPFYFLKTWFEGIEEFFTINTAQKADRNLRFAEKRLAEAQKMVEKGKTDLAQKWIDKYNERMDKALDLMNKAKEKGKDVKDVASRIEEATSKHLEILRALLSKVPVQARKGIERALEVSQTGQERALEAQGKSRRDIILKRREEIKQRIEEQRKEREQLKSQKTPTPSTPKPSPSPTASPIY